MATIYEKLLQVQAKLSVPKEQRNDFGKYNYRNCEDILEAVKPLLKRNKLVLFLSDTLNYINGRYYVEATANLVDIESGEKLQATASAREEENKKGMDGSQITGASSSYARKYALNGLFCIDDTKDSDTTNQGNGQKKSGTVSKTTYHCEKCGKEIKDIRKKDGTIVPAKESYEKCGRLCIKCYQEANKKSEPENLVAKLNDLLIRFSEAKETDPGKALMVVMKACEVKSLDSAGEEGFRKMIQWTEDCLKQGE